MAECQARASFLQEVGSSSRKPSTSFLQLRRAEPREHGRTPPSMRTAAQHLRNTLEEFDGKPNSPKEWSTTAHSRTEQTDHSIRRSSAEAQDHAERTPPQQRPSSATEMAAQTLTAAAEVLHRPQLAGVADRMRSQTTDTNRRALDVIEEQLRSGGEALGFVSVKKQPSCSPQELDAAKQKIMDALEAKRKAQENLLNRQSVQSTLEGVVQRQNDAAAVENALLQKADQATTALNSGCETFENSLTTTLNAGMTEVRAKSDEYNSAAASADTAFFSAQTSELVQQFSSILGDADAAVRQQCATLEKALEEVKKQAGENVAARQQSVEQWRAQVPAAEIEQAQNALDEKTQALDAARSSFDSVASQCGGAGGAVLLDAERSVGLETVVFARSLLN